MMINKNDSSQVVGQNEGRNTLDKADERHKKIFKLQTTKRLSKDSTASSMKTSVTVDGSNTSQRQPTVLYEEPAMPTKIQQANITQIIKNDGSILLEPSEISGASTLSRRNEENEENKAEGVHKISNMSHEIVRNPSEQPMKPEGIIHPSIKKEPTAQSESINVSLKKQSGHSHKISGGFTSLHTVQPNKTLVASSLTELIEQNKQNNNPSQRESTTPYKVTYAPTMKSFEPRKPGVVLETVQSLTNADLPRKDFSTTLKSIEVTRGTSERGDKPVENAISKHILEPTSTAGTAEQTTYVRAARKLPTIGPLRVTDLDDFLRKSKVDFEHFYHKKNNSTLQITDFNLLKTLGIGGFGKVVLGELKKEKTLYALKVIEKVGVVKRNHVRYVSNEKRILQSLNFPFVIHLKFFFTDYYYLYFVMPYVPGGSFSKHLKTRRKLIESDAKFYISQLVLALEYLHHLDLIHRDLKTENIMIDATGYLKLVDFGQCIRCHGHDKTWTYTGTPEYMAPEIIVGKGYDCAVDWWALGIIAFEVCAGFRPFKHENSYKLQLLILCNQFSIPSGFSRSLKKLVQSLLVLEPKNRIANSSKKASLIKKHSWFKETDWLALFNRTIQAPYLPNLPRLSQHFNNKQCNRKIRSLV